MKKRLFAVFSAMSIVLCSVNILISCNESTGLDNTETSISEVVGNEQVSNDILTLASNNTSDYYIVRSDMDDGVEKEAAVKLRNTLDEKTGASFGITTDWEKNEVYECEIIVGSTEREKTENVEIDRIALGKNGFIIKAVDKKIFICGGSDEGTVLGVNYFIDTFASDETSTLTIPANYEYVQYQEYDIKSLTICGNDISQYTIVYDNDNFKESAELLQSSVYEKTGKMLNISEKDAFGGDKSILISSDSPEKNGVHYVTVKDGSLIFSTSAETGMTACVSAFISEYMSDAFGSYNISEGFIYATLGDYITIKAPK